MRWKWRKKKMRELESEAWEDFLDMTISQAFLWAATNTAPEQRPSEISAAEPYFIGSHSGAEQVPEVDGAGTVTGSHEGIAHAHAHEVEGHGEHEKIEGKSHDPAPVGEKRVEVEAVRALFDAEERPLNVRLAHLDHVEDGQLAADVEVGVGVGVYVGFGRLTSAQCGSVAVSVGVPRRAENAAAALPFCQIAHPPAQRKRISARRSSPARTQGDFFFFGEDFFCEEEGR
jgi:hypothetical protein